MKKSILLLPIYVFCSSAFADGNTFPNFGNVGIGTNAPSAPLSVEVNNTQWGTPLTLIRNTGPGIAFGIDLDATGTGNNDLAWTVNGVLKGGMGWDVPRQFIGFVNTVYNATDFGLRLNSDGSMTFHDSVNGQEKFRVNHDGSVGIGTNSPKVALDVNGGIRPGSTSVCGPGQAAGEGTQRYNSANHLMEFCNGSTWVSMAAAAAPPPTVPSGTLCGYSNTNDGQYDFCQGNNPAYSCPAGYSRRQLMGYGSAYTNNDGYISFSTDNGWTCVKS